MRKEEEYLQRADDCRRLAEQARSSFERASWQGLAEQWEGLARHISGEPVHRPKSEELQVEVREADA